ncbi:helix-turn-helix domain-containing protein [Microseira sp. BLCC-F43]|jgi:DNA-binding XRE family transcriptional regulator|uniref:helix-turn-helix domain-containing protein n=1 Tax=Microseira sp. BLCC-F43 TaxID=3153602 RepID=UPI0035BB97B8
MIKETWFLNASIYRSKISMLPSDKVQSSAAGKNKLREAYKAAGLTIETLAKKANVSEDTVKRLLGTKECPNGVERWAVINIAKVLNIQHTDIVDPKDWYPQQLPQEFRSLIEEKIKHFCGRKFVFNKFDEFVNSYPNGYFTIVGDAGMGKSAFAANYVASVRPCPCYFNILAEGRNRAELFLDSIRQQLINFYNFSSKKQIYPPYSQKLATNFPTNASLLPSMPWMKSSNKQGRRIFYIYLKPCPPRCISC